MKILIVDDEPGLAAGLAGWLEENGWGSPGVATTSDEAVEWINRNGRVDVLVCDVAINPADGFTLRETIQPHLPKMRTIFISGYDLSDHSARMEGCHFLAKPVTGEALDDAIRSVFEARTPKPSAGAAPRSPRTRFRQQREARGQSDRGLSASRRFGSHSETSLRLHLGEGGAERGCAIIGQTRRAGSESDRQGAGSARVGGGNAAGRSCGTRSGELSDRGQNRARRPRSGLSGGANRHGPARPPLHP